MNHKKIIFIISLLFLLIYSVFGLTANTWAAPLTVHPANPRYFTDGTGKAIYLTGSHTWYLIQKDPAKQQTDNSYQRMENYLDWAQSYGHNFQRVWANFSYLNLDGPFPWQRPGPGTAYDGKQKFNMSQFDQSYFNLLRERVLQITNRGMYVSVMIFGSGNSFKNPSGNWSKTAWNPLNNINTELASALSTTDGNSFYTPNTAAMNIQKMLVAKTIDTLNDQDNLIWEVVNEGQLPESEIWQKNMYDYIKSYESGKPKQHLLLMGASASINDNDILFRSSANCISPGGDQTTASPYDFPEGGDASYTDKIVINDSDHIGMGWSSSALAETYRKWVWKAFLRGTHPIFMDSYDAYALVDGILYNDGTIMPVFNPVRKAMGYTKSYADRLDLANAIPSSSSSDCSTTYCLKNSGNEYLVYQPNSGSFTVNLQTGTYSYEWFNPSNGNVIETGNLTVSDGNRSFTPSFSSDAVLYLKKAATDPYCGDGNCNGSETCSSCSADCKSCNTIPPLPGWTACAVEDETCSFSGTKEVQYGGNGTYIIKIFSGGVLCANSVFGDPLVGMEKYCYYRDITNTVPAAPTGVKVI